jgi:oligopeptide transport system permease protein
MLKFIIHRLLVAIPTMFCIILLVFSLIHLSSANPFISERALPPEVLKQLMHQYRLDLPLWKQFLLYLNDLLHGSFGYSYKFRGQSINELIFPGNMGGFWVTLTLALYAMFFSVILGVLSGIYAGIYKDTWLDRLIVTLSIIFSTTPTIVTGPLMILIFAVILHWLPAGGFGEGANFTHLFMPVLALVLAYAPTIAFVTRGSILEVLNANFIRTAKAKGLPQHIIIFRHAIRPTMIPVVSLLGPMFAGILVGAIVTEQVFALPGLGILTTNAAINRDYNMVMAITIFSGFLTILFNFIVDIMYFMLDPKVRQ